MSFFSGLNFFSLLFIFLIFAVVIGIWKYKYLRIYRHFGDILFIFCVYKATPQQLCYLVLYALLALYITKAFVWLCNNKSHSTFITGTAIGVLLTPLVIYKIGLLFDTNSCGFLGISYICFRSVQVLIEINDGLIKNFSALEYLGFLLFFPSLSSGPIDRSRRFFADNETVLSKDEYLIQVENGIFKLVLGLFYKIVCADFCFNLLESVYFDILSWKFFFARMWIYGLYLFFDFAGYSSMAVGTAYILGIKLPDNFNKPFISKDIKDFWNRWHISLSTWLRDFVFNRFVMWAIKNKVFDNRLNTAIAGYLMNMVIMGIWHGLSSQFILYGVYHGVLLSLMEVWQKSHYYKKYHKTKWYSFVSWILTINLVMFGFSIFSGDVDVLIHNLLRGTL